MKSEFLLSWTGNYTWQSLTATEMCNLFIIDATLFAVLRACTLFAEEKILGADFTVIFLS